MSHAPTIPWPRQLWDAALQVTDHKLPVMCPLCPNPSGTEVTVSGQGSFSVPLGPNADGCTIAVLDGDNESTVVWKPCRHSLTVEGRLLDDDYPKDQPWPSTR